MKKIFIAIFALMAFCTNVSAQLSTDIATMRAVVAGPLHYGCSTFHCRTKAIEAAEADTVYGFLYRLSTALASSGDLNSVLTLGNESALNVNIFNPAVEFRTIHSAQGIATEYVSPMIMSPEPVTYLGWFGGAPGLYIRNGFGNFAYLRAGTLTGLRQSLLPDEGDGSGLDATIVLHTTKDPITVDNSTGLTSTIGVGLITVNDGTYRTNLAGSGLNCIANAGSVIQWTIGTTAGSTFFMVKDGGTEYTRLNTLSTYTALRDNYFPDEGSNLDIPGSTIVLHKTKDPITIDAGVGQETVVGSAQITEDDGAGGTMSLLPNTLSLQKSGISYFEARQDHVQITDVATGVIARLQVDPGDNTPCLILQDGAGAFRARLESDVLGANAVIKLPKYTGSLFINKGGNSSQALVAAATMVITHGAPYTPSRVIPIPKDAGAAAAWQGAYVSAIGATTFTITFAAPVTATCTFDFQTIP